MNILAEFCIDQSFYQRIFNESKANDKFAACLVGYKSSKNIACIIGAIKVDELKSNEILKSLQFSHILPAGLFICGLIFNGDKEQLFEVLPKEFKELNDIIGILPLNNDDEIDEISNFYSFNTTTNLFTKQNLNFINNPLKETVKFSIKQTIDITYNKSNHNSLKANIELLKNGLENSSFHIQKANIILLNNDSIISTNCNGNDNLFEILNIVTEEKEETGFEIIDKKQKKKTKNVDFNKIIDVSILESSRPQKNVKNCVPVVKKHNSDDMKFSIQFNVLTIVNKDEKLKDMYKYFLQGLERQLSGLEKFISKSMLSNSLCIYYFWPSMLQHPICCWYPVASNDNELESTRRLFHDSLFLPKIRPMFRKGNEHIFGMPNIDENGLLICPHRNIKSGSTVKGGKSSIVHGLYTYHHYCQDNFNDKGWGCAYRSLQTLFSWYKLQAFTEKTIPTIIDIQQTLIDIGDKQLEFKGSRQWIGSFEVSFVLEKLIGIQSKFITSILGSDMLSNVRQLAIHFDRIGSPIMIGGNNLAHTILGIDFNEHTGEAEYLILDPHYTGGEDLELIIKKGWCGWKKNSFWNQNVSYNICLPQTNNLI